MSTVNLAEVMTIALRNYGARPALLEPRILKLGIEVFEFTIADAVAVADLWPETKPQGLSLGDRACLALGKRLGVKVLTAERARDWRGLRLKGIEVERIR